MFKSSMTVAAFIADIKSQMDNPYADSVYTGWLNEVEQPLYAEILEEYKQHDFTVTTAATDAPIALSYVESTLTKTFMFEDIRKVEIKHGAGKFYEYSPATLIYVPTDSYYKDGEKLGYSDPKDGDTIRVKYRERPAVKIPTNKDTDCINLPDSFIKVVKYYCFSQILKLKREFGAADNWANDHNAALADFVTWYDEHKPKYGG